MAMVSFQPQKDLMRGELMHLTEEETELKRASAECAHGHNELSLS